MSTLPVVVMFPPILERFAPELLVCRHGILNFELESNKVLLNVEQACNPNAQPDWSYLIFPYATLEKQAETQQHRP